MVSIEHFEKHDCDMIVSKCHLGCEKMMQIWFRSVHETVCDFRIERCPLFHKCKTRTDRPNLLNHFKDCSRMYPELVHNHCNIDRRHVNLVIHFCLTQNEGVSQPAILFNDIQIELCVKENADTGFIDVSIWFIKTSDVQTAIDIMEKYETNLHMFNRLNNDHTLKRKLKYIDMKEFLDKEKNGAKFQWCTLDNYFPKRHLFHNKTTETMYIEKGNPGKITFSGEYVKYV